MITNLISKFGAVCAGNNFFSFPHWYKYIRDPNNCSVVKIDNINDVWLIVAAVIEILLRVAGIVAVGFVIYGGFQYLTSQAEPDKVNKAKNTIINALVGLMIAILASAIINFIAGSIT
jgi:ABC-type Fe3+ transport system permease subunit